MTLNSLDGSFLKTPSKEDIHVVRSGEDQTGKSHTKKGFCLFCKESFNKLPRHFMARHSKEGLVVKLKKLKKKSGERNNLCNFMRNLGNLNHNIEVVKEKNGSFVVARSPEDEVSYRQYYPCCYCFATLTRSELGRHLKTCPEAPQEEKNKTHDFIIRSKVGWLSAIDKVTPEMSRLIASFANDEIATVAKSDHYICLFGQTLFDKYNDKRKMEAHVRNGMRELARLKIALIEETEDRKDDALVDFVNARDFDHLCKVVNRMAEKDQKPGAGRKNTFALKCG